MATWRVVTWNVLGSRGVLTDRVAQVLQGLRPDVVALQEISRRQTRRLAKQLRWRHSWTLKHYPSTRFLWWRAEGLAILSAGELSGTVHATISTGFATSNYRRRVVLAASVTRHGSQLRIFNTHLGGSPAERIPQAARIAAVVADERLVATQRAERSGRAARFTRSVATTTITTVVAGDLNAADDPLTLQPLLELGLRDPGGGNSSTALDPYQRIDYILVPVSATVSERTTPSGGGSWDVLSDHLPVLVEFTISDDRPEISTGPSSPGQRPEGHTSSR